MLYLPFQSSWLHIYMWGWFRRFCLALKYTRAFLVPFWHGTKFCENPEVCFNFGYFGCLFAINILRTWMCDSGVTFNQMVGANGFPGIHFWGNLLPNVLWGIKIKDLSDTVFQFKKTFCNETMHAKSMCSDNSCCATICHVTKGPSVVSCFWVVVKYSEGAEVWI